MTTTTIQLQLSDEQAAQLQTIANQFGKELESNVFPQQATLHQLKQQLQASLTAQDGFTDFWEDSEHQHSTSTLRLVHEHTAIRNLPWQLALEERPEVALLKSIKTTLEAHQPTLGYPLKVLVMVAAPEGVTRLDYEREELLLLSAFSPLMSKGLVEVHFTDDGSLEELEAKLLENRYHILHFSGHGAYADGEGYLALEDPITGKLKKANATDLNAVFRKVHQKGHRPELVLLSACQTAQGVEDSNISGVANILLRGGVPAVVAMSTSILDTCASAFAAYLYELLSNEFTLPYSFQQARQQLQDYEIQTYKPAQRNLAPGQWLIPQLLLSQDIDQLIDKNAPRTELDFSQSLDYVTGKEALLELRVRPDNYVFVGRRREKRTTFPILKQGQAVLLRGQGGMGKTALAEHLAIRMLVSNPSTRVFTHSEKTPAADSLLKQMQEYLTKEKRKFSVVSQLALIKKLQDKFMFLLEEVSQFCDPLFIFDNVESFQGYDSEKEAWLWNVQQHEDVLTLLQLLHQYTNFPMIVTGRYPLAEFPDWTICDLNAVPFGDFFKKCWQLQFSELSQKLQKTTRPVGLTKKDGQTETTFRDVAKLLHETLGGNYRALEFFDELYVQERDDVFSLLAKLDDLQTRIQESEVLNRMSENLIFEQLLSYLNEDDRDTLALLAHYRIPVLPMAIGFQREASDRSASLSRLCNLTLLEQQPGIDERNRYYVAPLVKELLRQADFPEVNFSPLKAAEYHEYVFDEKLYLDDISEYTEAFEWYHEAKDIAGVNRTGERLNRFYYNVQQFRLSLVYGLRTEEVAQEDTDGNIWNRLGLAFKLFGQYDTALSFYKKAAIYYEKIGDRKGEGTTLNNLATTAHAKGDYDTALQYLEQVLEIDKEIDKEIGDRQGESTTVGNIASIYYSKGDYDKALVFFQKDLKITQEIGDRKGEGTTLNNISQIHKVKGDYDTALQYLQQALKIQQEIGDRKGEGATLNNISQIYDAKGDYDTALQYLQQALKIRQDIGDTYGLAESYHNIGALFYEQEKYEDAIALLFHAYQIFERIGSPNAQTSAGYLEAIIEKIGEEKFKQIIARLQQT